MGATDTSQGQRRTGGVRAAVLAFCALFALMLAPALINRGGFVYADTSSYVRGADAAMMRVTGHPTAWSDRLLNRFSAAIAPAPAAVAQGAPAAHGPPSGGGDHVALSGRSVYYGLLLYLSLLADSLWPAVAVQAALTAAAILLTVEKFSGRGAAALTRPGTLAAVLLLPLLTAVGYFAAFAMPDMFAPLAILAIANLALPPFAGAGLRVLFWTALLVFAFLAHSATVLIGGALLGVLLLLRLAGAGKVRLLLPFLALLAGLAGEWAFGVGVKHATGAAPVRPPFLTARLLEDGPGAAYLRTHCGPEAHFEVCRFRDRPVVLADTFLWSSDPQRGVFMTLPPDRQRALSAEQVRFVLAVFRADPLGTSGAALRDVARQLGRVGLEEFNIPDELPALRESVPPRPMAELAATRALHGTMPVEPAQMLALPIEIGGILLLTAFVVATGGSPREPVRQARLFAITILCGVLVNAAVCGVLSGPHQRYQARVIYLLPLALIAVWDRIVERLRLGSRRG